MILQQYIMDNTAGITRVDEVVQLQQATTFVAGNHFLQTSDSKMTWPVESRDVGVDVEADAVE